MMRLTALAGATLLLAGCSSINIDQTLHDTQQRTGGFTQGKLELSRTTTQQQRFLSATFGARAASCGHPNGHIAFSGAVSFCQNLPRFFYPLQR